jgi:hypothetical protein
MDYVKEYSKKCKAFGKKELSVLNEHLNSKEKVIDIVGGQLKQKGVDGTGILVLSNQRVFFLDKSLFNVKLTEHSFDHINSISFKKSVVYGDIVINVAGSKISVGAIDKNFVQSWVENAKQYIGKKEQKESTSSLDELEKLAKLKEKGIISDKEFKDKKKKILAL